MICNRWWRCWPTLALAGVLAMVVSNIQSAPTEDDAPAGPPADASPLANEESIPADVVADMLRLRQLPRLALFDKSSDLRPFASDDAELPYATDDTMADEAEIFENNLNLWQLHQRQAIVTPTRLPHESAVPHWSKQQPPPIPMEAIQALRAAAFELDKVAHQLECFELSDRCDQVREVAQQLRVEARERTRDLWGQARD